MAVVIAEPCVGTCDQACVDVCPVDCIQGPLPNEQIRAAPKEERAARFGRLQLYVDPESCICCNACEPECPVRAIYDEDDLPPEWQHYREKNAAFFRGAR